AGATASGRIQGAQVGAGGGRDPQVAGGEAAAPRTAAAAQGRGGGGVMDGNNVVPGRWSTRNGSGYRDIGVEVAGHVATVRWARPAGRKAVGGPVGAELAGGFRAVEKSDARAAVLYGDGGTFCAVADLRPVNTPKGNRLEAAGDGPMGVS